MAENRQLSIIIAGNSGQGISLIANVIAYAGFLEEINVKMIPMIFPKTQTQERIYSIGFSKDDDFSFFSSPFDIMLLCSRDAENKLNLLTKESGLCIYNSSVINTLPVDGIRKTGVNASQLALSMGNLKIFNMIMLGALSNIIEIISDQSIIEAIKHELPSLTTKLLSLNLNAYHKGKESINL